MFIITPTLLFLASLSAISIIVWRKKLYIKKLVVVDGQLQNGSTSLSNKEFFFKLLNEMFPEMVETFKNIKFSEYKDSWLVEAEKFIRRLRLLSLRMDRLSATLIHKIRKVNNDKPVIVDIDTKPLEASLVVPAVDAKENNSELWKKEEQRLIIEIAKNPKSPKLYDGLGDLYIKMGDYSDAKESFEAAMELDPNNEDLKKKLSLVLEKLNTQISHN